MVASGACTLITEHHDGSERQLGTRQTSLKLTWDLIQKGNVKKSGLVPLLREFTGVQQLITCWDECTCLDDASDPAQRFIKEARRIGLAGNCFSSASLVFNDDTKVFLGLNKEESPQP